MRLKTATKNKLLSFKVTEDLFKKVRKSRLNIALICIDALMKELGLK